MVDKVEKPLVAKVLAIAGKYHFLDVGANDNVQVDDFFEDVELVRLQDPDNPDYTFAGVETEDGSTSWGRAVVAELQVERVFADHCYAVICYSAKLNHFEVGSLVEKGHPYRITAAGNRTGRR